MKTESWSYIRFPSQWLSISVHFSPFSHWLLMLVTVGSRRYMMKLTLGCRCGKSFWAKRISTKTNFCLPPGLLLNWIEYIFRYDGRRNDIYGTDTSIRIKFEHKENLNTVIYYIIYVRTIVDRSQYSLFTHIFDRNINSSKIKIRPLRASAYNVGINSIFPRSVWFTTKASIRIIIGMYTTTNQTLDFWSSNLNV